MKRLWEVSLVSLFTITACTNNTQTPNPSISASSTHTPSSSVSATPSPQPNGNLTVKYEMISYYKNKENVKGYLLYPEKEGKYPALVLIHEWWGLNDNIKEFSKKFAEKGYVTLAVDLYEGDLATTPEKAREFATRVRSNPDEAKKHLKNAIDFIKTKSNVNPEKTASVGWCFGGNWSYEIAKNDLGVKASVMYYGSFAPEDDLKMMKSHILGHFGEKDTSIKLDDVKQFQATLKTLSGNHEVYIYPNSGHGFANSENPNYNKESADLAWTRTLEFLSKNL